MTEIDAVQSAYDRVRTCDPWLRAFVDVRRPETTRSPVAVTTGPLAGLPIAVKGRAGYTSSAATRLTAHGAVPIGATSTPRGGGHQTWGHTDRGPTRNPWREDLSPGGSSAGSAAAVAAGIMDLATGTDGAGSVRIPAAWCSIIGYKPSTALAPVTDRTGLAVPGVLVRDPRLLRAWAAAVLDRPLEVAPSVATAAWSTDLGFAGCYLDDEVTAIARSAAERLAHRAGIGWDEHLDVRLRDPEPAWTTFRDRDATAVRRHAAATVRAENARALGAIFDRVDVLMCSTTPGRAHGHDGPGRHMSVALTWAFNISGHPAVSVPAGFTADGTPVGLQIIARPGGDGSLLTLLEDHVDVAPVAPIPASAAGGGRMDP